MDVENVVSYLLGRRSMRGALLSLYPTDTVTDAAVANFPDGANNVPVVDLTAAINPVQSGSGDPAPDNVRPISGWTGANIVVSPTQDAQDGTTYSVSWQSAAGTVYGGTLDVTTGLLTVTMISETFTSINRVENVSGVSLWIIRTGVTTPLFDNINGTVISNIFDGKLWANGHLWWANTTPFIGARPHDQSLNTKALADAWLAEHPCQLVFTLAEPLTYQLSPTEVKTLLGQNYIWSDTGIISVEYRADVELYIEKKIGEGT